MSRFSGTVMAAILVCSSAAVGPAAAQCLLANPSFELPGTSTTFGGWNQFGPTGSSPVASHGHAAARVSGLNNGSGDVAGFWQPLDTAPGDRWLASVRAFNTSGMPLAGGSKAILNIEWRGAGGNLIGYESHTVANAASPQDEWIDFSVESGPAPASAVQTRMLLGVQQGPTDPQPAVLFDEATFVKAGPPTLDQIQWNDFPGGRTVVFNGRTWRVKGPGYYGPGPNLFCDAPGCVWVDANDQLHLRMQNISGQWYSSEVALEQALGYGDYIFTTVGRLDQLDPRVVFGLFLWQYGPCYDSAFLWWNPFNEVDVEFSRWGSLGNDIAQFVAQPFDYPGNTERFDATFSNGELTSHAFRWLEDRVEFRSWRGGPLDEAPGTMIHAWTYLGPHIPRPEQPRVHINIWRFSDPPSTPQEVVLDAFVFVPPGASVDVPRPVDPSGPGRMLDLAHPNPFIHATRIRYTLPLESQVDLALFDISGRRVRTLVSGLQQAGPHEVTWDGTDDAGLRPRPGIYVYRLDTGRRSESGRVVLLR